MSVATLARKLGLALPNSSMRKMFGVMAGVQKQRERKQIPKRRQVWEIPTCSRRAPLSLAGVGGWECNRHHHDQGRSWCFSRDQALITASLLTHTSCLRAVGSPQPSLPGAVLSYQDLSPGCTSALPCLPQTLSVETALIPNYWMHHLQHSSSQLRIPSGLRKTTHPTREVRP